ncbi:hypothetical protein PAXRUDRAFT_835169 [Paxillus rubicundulus Ve08.2h10]|uniref:Uncharacterized protein n=1 Tax=Paxillus rubicundulus Ve08.2h10 TaxID=930991 RepID=A0A0D0C149_9AGAM|nr:hypothetical protein PAXRUDRAFT_835169 [Paxillus rubicundulus Ve08.2h10]
MSHPDHLHLKFPLRASSCELLGSVLVRRVQHTVAHDLQVSDSSLSARSLGSGDPPLQSKGFRHAASTALRHATGRLELQFDNTRKLLEQQWIRASLSFFSSFLCLGIAEGPEALFYSKVQTPEPEPT